MKKFKDENCKDCEYTYGKSRWCKGCEYGSKKSLLYNADENCEHKTYGRLAGGIKCKKCSGWFCY